MVHFGENTDTNGAIDVSIRTTDQVCRFTIPPSEKYRFRPLGNEDAEKGVEVLKPEEFLVLIAVRLFISGYLPESENESKKATYERTSRLINNQEQILGMVRDDTLGATASLSQEALFLSISYLAAKIRHLPTQ
ncbi:MAG TPA: hypothetical protein PK765_05620 [bacterium]|nr:hypothetical protein [bacterium]